MAATVLSAMETADSIKCPWDFAKERAMSTVTGGASWRRMRCHARGNLWGILGGVLRRVWWQLRKSLASVIDGDSNSCNKQLSRRYSVSFNDDHICMIIDLSILKLSQFYQGNVDLPIIFSQGDLFACLRVRVDPDITFH
ncbi:hypothetical protein HPP92_004539 [Vanilla planifolia]|uniref:Uncharacterized protein n=1 Tax=Vanilla planifolia TaxID=51239 RepID=A0A835S9M1_VANPL|nr:hypothetical protein HPP92_004539 [Vanilla planifolia]